MYKGSKPFIHLEFMGGLTSIAIGILGIYLPPVREFLQNLWDVLRPQYIQIGGWFFLALGIFLAFLWSPYKVWKQTDDERERLQTQIDSRESNVELTDFDHELTYKRMTDSRGDVIVIRLAGRLRNTSPENSGSLDYFRVDVPTPRGIYLAVSRVPPLGHTFEPNSIYPNQLFTFTGDFADPLIKLESWEPLIKGAKGRINLAVQGQRIKTYPIKIADKEGFG